MHEPGHTVATAGGLIIFGVTTGIDPLLLVAGAVGGWYAVSNSTERLPFISRFGLTFFSALFAAWSSPAIAAGIATAAWWPKTVPPVSMTGILALLIGALAHPVLMPAAKRFVQRKAEE